VNNGQPRATSTTGGTFGTASAKPSPTQSGLIDTCTTFYKAVAGDSCAKIAKKYGTFTEAQFIKWNPAVGEDCAAIWVQNYYCVGIPGTPTSPPASTTTTSTGTPRPSPTQSGIIDTCTRYYEAQSGDGCSSVVKQFGSFDFEDFLRWNPAVGADCKGFWAKTYYCVGMFESSSPVTTPVLIISLGVPGTPTTPTATAIIQPTCAGAPTPTQPGALCKCKKWHKVVKDEGCETIEKKYGISNDNFAKWNTQVSKNCATLWLSYNVCVGV
jgi:LysM repeat protein